ncbi:hypothetical protein COB52_02600 [Candidatus Kaiserbacteria bacterium]|nr:MAG: hypothetical protein COB52_02600 [Candidatus Kaiserbacteria bacterium]
MHARQRWEAKTHGQTVFEESGRGEFRTTIGCFVANRPPKPAFGRENSRRATVVVRVTERLKKTKGNPADRRCLR